MFSFCYWLDEMEQKKNEQSSPFPTWLGAKKREADLSSRQQLLVDVMWTFIRALLRSAQKQLSRAKVRQARKKYEEMNKNQRLMNGWKREKWTFSMAYFQSATVFVVFCCWSTSAKYIHWAWLNSTNCEHLARAPRAPDTWYPVEIKLYTLESLSCVSSPLSETSWGLHSSKSDVSSDFRNYFCATF